MAADKQQNIPDPLRTFKAGDVIAMTSHSSFQKPEGVEDQAWAAAIEEVRTAVRAVRLDVPIDASASNFLPGVCRGVDQRIRVYGGEGGVNKKRLHDPVIDAVREQIGLFLSIRIRLGRNKKFGDLIKAIKKAKGVTSLTALEQEDQGLHAIVQTMRTIVKDASSTAARKEAIWKYIKEFLAEQAGLDSIDFPGQKFTDEKPEDNTGKKLRKLGITLTHSSETERRTGRVDRLNDEALEDVGRHIAAIDKFLKDLRPASERAQTSKKLLSIKMTQAEQGPQGPLQDFKRREQDLTLARATLLEVTELTELAPKDERAHKARLAELEEEFAEPLRGYKELEASMEEINSRVEGMEELKDELQEKLGKLRQLEAMLKVVKFGEEDKTEAGETSAPVAVAVAAAPAPAASSGLAIAARPAARLARSRRPDRPSGGGKSRPPGVPRPSAPDALRTTSDGRFSVDDLVTHAKFGRGTIIGVDPLKSIVRVQFERDGVGTKVISYDSGDFLTGV